MSLLNDLFHSSLDEGYAEATARREASGDTSSTTARIAKSPALLVGLLGVGLLFTVAAMQVQKDAGTVSVERESLLQEVSVASDRTAQLERQISALEDQLVEIESRSIDSLQAGDELRQSMSAAQSVVGTAPVTGPGIVVEINDAEPGTVGVDECSPQVVVDLDLQIVLNGLWATGAEAVSLNGERITPLTAIRAVNEVVLVNSRPVAAPYQLSAIGNSQTFAGDFAGGSGGQWLRTIHNQCGIRFSIEIHQSLRLPGGAASLQVAEPEVDS